MKSSKSYKISLSWKSSKTLQNQRINKAIQSVIIRITKQFLKSSTRQEQAIKSDPIEYE